MNETATIIIIVSKWLQNILWYISNLKVYLKWVRMCVGFKWLCVCVRASKNFTYYYSFRRTIIFSTLHFECFLFLCLLSSHFVRQSMQLVSIFLLISFVLLFIGFYRRKKIFRIKLALVMHSHRTVCSLAHRYWTFEANILYRTNFWIFVVVFRFYCISFDVLFCFIWFIQA